MAEPSDRPPVPDLDGLPGAIARTVFELNLYLRAASLAGLEANVDLVERENPAHPGGYTEVLVDLRGEP